MTTSETKAALISSWICSLNHGHQQASATKLFWSLYLSFQIFKGPREECLIGPALGIVLSLDNSANLNCWELILNGGEGNGNPLQSSCLENPWTEGPGGLQSKGSLRVWHNWATSLSLFTFMHWRRKWQPTLVFLPGESQGWWSLVGCRLWGRTELDTTKAT